jgi:hypothetical protein
MGEGVLGRGRRFGVTTGIITSTEDSFPYKNFFLNINNLYIDDIGDNVNANLNANANANARVAPYVILSFHFQILLEFLILVICLDAIYVSCLDVICSYVLLPPIRNKGRWLSTNFLLS